MTEARVDEQEITFADRPGEAGEEEIQEQQEHANADGTIDVPEYGDPAVEVPEIRKLRDGDTYRVAKMLGKIMGDENLRWAGSMNDPMMIAMAGVAALAEHAPREIQLFVADLIGVAGDRETHKQADAERQAREIQAMRKWREEYAEAEKGGEANLELFLKGNPEPQVYKLKGAREIDRDVEDEILEKMDAYPPGTTQEIIARIMERDDFLPFVTSSMRLIEVGKTLSSRFSNLSKKLSGSRTETS